MKDIGMITIGEAASRVGVPAKTIRLYENAGIVRPATRGSNRYRAYSDADEQKLRFVRSSRPAQTSS
jgi:MerR family copper efflux transcriptional regulator